MLKNVAKIIAINGALSLFLLVCVELIFGNWLRPLSVTDLKRFSIPVEVSYTFDVSGLYARQPGTIRYSRDSWGLRGTFKSLEDVKVLTVGGSTTDQKFLDDADTWQAVAERQLESAGSSLKIANAGVDGQSTTGHIFDFQYWFPLLQGLKPRYVVFYVGINDVMMRDDRGSYDASLDASNWRVKSAVWQLVRLARGNLAARNAQVSHGRKRDYRADEFTSEGILEPEARGALASRVTKSFIANIATLSNHARAIGATPVFMTQSAFAWHAGSGPPRGLAEQIRIHGMTMNYADVSFLHQNLNRSLMRYCVQEQLQCFDAAEDLQMDSGDYYDFLHATPSGAHRLGTYLAQSIASLTPSSAP